MYLLVVMININYFSCQLPSKMSGIITATEDIGGDVNLERRDYRAFNDNGDPILQFTKTCDFHSASRMLYPEASPCLNVPVISRVHVWNWGKLRLQFPVQTWPSRIGKAFFGGGDQTQLQGSRWIQAHAEWIVQPMWPNPTRGWISVQIAQFRLVLGIHTQVWKRLYRE